jgi:hypothetical protein
MHPPRSYQLGALESAPGLSTARLGAVGRGALIGGFPGPIRGTGWGELLATDRRDPGTLPGPSAKKQPHVRSAEDPLNWHRSIKKRVRDALTHGSKLDAFAGFGAAYSAFQRQIRHIGGPQVEPR